MQNCEILIPHCSWCIVELWKNLSWANLPNAIFFFHCAFQAQALQSANDEEMEWRMENEDAYILIELVNLTSNFGTRAHKNNK